MVTPSVVASPWTTMPSESPTSRASTPAPSSKRAIVQSYAVSTASGVPHPLAARNSGTVLRLGFEFTAPLLAASIDDGEEAIENSVAAQTVLARCLRRRRRGGVHYSLCIAAVGATRTTNHNDRTFL